jgi:hypothetical protein
VKDIRAETWSKAYRYPVDNGIRAAVVALVAYISSHLLVAGHRYLVSYEGQPPAFCGCNDSGHAYIECPKRKIVEEVGGEGRSLSWADVSARGRRAPVEETEVITEQRTITRLLDQADRTQPTNKGY